MRLKRLIPMLFAAALGIFLYAVAGNDNGSLSAGRPAEAASCGYPDWFWPCYCHSGRNSYGQTCEVTRTYVFGIPSCGWDVGTNSDCYDYPPAGGQNVDGGATDNPNVSNGSCTCMDFTVSSCPSRCPEDGSGS